MKSIAFIAMVAVAGFASAAMLTFSDPITEAQEVPPSGSLAAGIAWGTYDTDTNELKIDVLATGFDSTVTMAHIHNAPVGSNGPVVRDLGVGTAPGFQYTNTAKMFTLTDVEEADFLAGNYYVNIHSERIPSGEIRGQLNPVPEPATMIALGAGLAAIPARKRRK